MNTPPTSTARLRRHAILGAVLAGTLAVVTACSAGSGTEAGSAKALPTSPDVSGIQIQDVASVNLATKFRETPQEINNYWSADRIKKAKPYDPSPAGPTPAPSKPKPTPTTTPTPHPTTHAPVPTHRPTPKPTHRPAPPKRTTKPAPRHTTAKPKPRPTHKASRPRRKPVPKPTPKPTHKASPPRRVPTTHAPAPTHRPAPKTTPAAPRTTAKPAPRTTARPTPPRTTAKPKPTPTRTTAKPTPRPKPPKKTTRPPAPVPPRDPGANTIINPTRGRPNSNSVLRNVNSGATFGKPGLTKSTAGRLYFKFGSEDWVCSATVVHSSSADVVATAGHCVWDTMTGNRWGNSFMFIPNDANNGASSPYGRWYATRAYTTQAFVKTARENTKSSYGAGWAYDNAFLKMAKNNGRKIEQVTGGQGIAFGIPVKSVISMGYPSAAPFDGRSERYCSASSWDSAPSVYGDRGIPCAMTPGCSGGAWLANFNTSSGAGYLVGVNSVGGSDGKGHRYLFAAQMGSAALNTYKLAISGR